MHFFALNFIVSVALSIRWMLEWSRCYGDLRAHSVNERIRKKRVTVRCFHLPYITLCLRVFCVCVCVCSFYQVFHSREVNKLKLLNNDAEVILVIYYILVLRRLLSCSIPLYLFLFLNILFKSFAIFGNSSLKIFAERKWKRFSPYLFAVVLGELCMCQSLEYRTFQLQW